MKRELESTGDGKSIRFSPETTEKIVWANFMKNFPQGLDRTEKYDKINKRLENKLMFMEGSP